jgi:tetratricopeptide (TPR) repeat protein/CHAT domain-containing protein
MICFFGGLLYAASLSGQTYQIADSLWKLAQEKEKGNIWEQAAVLWEQAAIAENACTEPRLEYLYYYAKNASIDWYEIGNYNRAFILRKASYEIAKRLFPADHEEIGQSASWLGWYYKEKSEYSKALSLFLEALENCEKNLGKDHSTYGDYLGNLAILYETMGQNNRALPLYLEALQNAEKNLGRGHSTYRIRLSNLAGLYSTMFQYEKALPLYLEALEICEKTEGKEKYEYGLCASDLADLYEKMGQFDKALPLYLEALEICERTKGKEEYEYGLRANNLAQLYQKMGMFDKALPLFHESLSNAEKAKGKNDEEYAVRLSNLGALYLDKGDYQKALTYFEEALTITEKSIGKNHEKYIVMLSNLAVSYNKIGRYQEAIVLEKEALTITENLYGKGHPFYARRLWNIAVSYKNLGEFEKAISLNEEALLIYQKSKGKMHTEYETGLNNLALLYQTIGNFEKALSLYEESLQITRITVGEAHPSFGTKLNNIALLYQSLGEFDKAIEIFEQALKNAEKGLGKGHPEYAAKLNNLSLLYFKLGLYEKAWPLFEESMSSIQLNLGNMHPDFLKSWITLGKFSQALGQFERAKEIYLDLLPGAEKIVGKGNPVYGTILNNLAISYVSLGKPELALPYALDARKNAEKNLGKEHFEYALMLNNLASIYHSLGQFEMALPLYLEALIIYEKKLGKFHFDYSHMLNNIGLLYSNMNQPVKAGKYYDEALEIIKGEISKQFAFLSEKEREALITNALIAFDVYLGFFNKYNFERKEYNWSAYDLELTRKGLLLQSSIAMRQAVLQSGDTTLLRQFEDWSSTKSIIANQNSLPIKERRSDLVILEGKAEQMEADLTRKFAVLKGALQVGQTNWQQVRDALPENAVAFEFVSFPYRSAKGWSDSTLYMALVLRRGDTMPHMIPLFEQRQLDSITKRKGGDESFVSNLYRGVKLGLSQTEKTQYGKRLFELVWKPLDSLLQPGYDIYLSPSGALNQLAFAAIPYDSVSTLSDRYRLHTVTTTATLLREKPNDRPQSISIYGGVAFDSASVTVSADPSSISRSIPADLQRSGETWGYLPGTLQEAESITATAAKKQIKVDLHKGKEATEESLKAQTGNNAPDVLHIATHGFFFPDPKNNRKEQYALISQQEPIFKLSENPLNRSGIVLAGANKTWAGSSPEEGREDGILTAYEASYLQLAKTKLVVLSACETGLGDIKGSEGVYGLQRAFKQAGAEYLLMSLWKVPDNETAEFMTTFYGHYFGGSFIEDAYQLTQKAMREKYRNEPYKWAAFVLIR